MTEQTPIEQVKIGKKIFWISLATSVLVSLIISALMVKFGAPLLEKLFIKKTEVPNLKGVILSEAKQILENRGFITVVSGEKYNDEIPAGSVTGQSPIAGLILPEKSKIEIIISKGKEKVSVPVLFSLSKEEATAQLTSLGLSVGDVSSEKSAGVPKGRVISCIPATGTEVEKGTVIDITVSAGAPVKRAVIVKVSVPNLWGKTLPEAQALLDSRGLKLGRISRTTSIDHDFDIILRQKPAAGSSVPKGSSVEVTINAETEE
ncbi:MAG: PASTA domain-containing protein [Elusimicrobiota bacterium]